MDPTDDRADQADATRAAVLASCGVLFWAGVALLVVLSVAGVVVSLVD